MLRKTAFLIAGFWVINALIGCSDPLNETQQQAWKAYYMGDSPAAYETFQVSAKQHDDATSALAASLLAQEDGNNEAAQSWLQKAVAMGSPAAAYTQVYHTYRAHNAQLPPAEMAEVVSQLQQLAERDFAPAILGLGILLASEENPSDESLTKAFSYLQQAHDAGSQVASFTLGLAHVLGQDQLDIDLGGVDGFEPQPKKGVTYLEQALSDDFVLPAFFLASIYEQGIPGISPDLAKAQRYNEQLGDNIYSLIRNLDLAELQPVTLADLLSEQQKQTVLSDIQHDAEQQDANALVALAQLYQQGKLVTQDRVQAKAYYQQAAEHGNALAFWQLAKLSDGKARLNYLEQAADGDYVAALNELAGVYGVPGKLGVYPSKVLSSRYLKRAAELADTEAQIKLAERYLAGEGVPASLKKATIWLEKAAVAHPKHADIQLKLARVIDQDDYRHNDTANQLAFRYYQQAHQLDKGNGFAALRLASFYKSGRGVAQDHGKALALYEKALAASTDFVLRDIAKLEIARYYRAGGDSFAQDLPRAHQLLQELASEEDEEALIMLAEDYLAGNGLPKDKPKAVELFELAAEYGNSHALVRLKLFALSKATASKRQSLHRKILDEAHYLPDDSPLRQDVFALLDPANEDDLQWLFEEVNDGEQPDPKALEYLKHLAATHSTPLVHYFYGRVLLKDLNRAEEGLEKIQQAADSQTYAAMMGLGRLYDSPCPGCLLPSHNSEKALYWYTQAANSPDATDTVFRYLGDIYYRGWGELTKDYAKSLAWYSRLSSHSLSENGHLSRLNSRIIELEEFAAQVKQKQKAYQQGDLEAGFELAEWYRDWRQGLAEPDKALVLMTSLADKGFSKAQMALADNRQYYRDFALTEAERSRFYLAAANNGNQKAMQAIAERLLQGNGIEPNRAQARAWYEQAGSQRLLRAMDDFERNKQHVEQGDSEVQYQLGIAYKKGAGTLADGKKAEHYLRLAAEAGHSKALYQLADLYSQGFTGAIDWQNAIVWYRKAETGSKTAYFEQVVAPAEQGDMAAMTQLGADYLTRSDSDSNQTTKNAYAMAWLEKANEQGGGEASYILAREYRRGADAKAEDARKHQHYLQLAAEQGHPEAQYQVGQLVFDQALPSPQSWQLSMKLFQQAAAQGHPKALSALLNLYHNGFASGLSSQPEQVRPLLEDSCEKYAFACRVFASAHLQGEYGLDRDGEAAIEVLKREQAVQDIASQRMLADIYLRGTAGATQDWQQANRILTGLYDSNLKAKVEGDSSGIKQNDTDSRTLALEDDPASATKISQLLHEAYQAIENDITEREKQPRLAIFTQWAARAFDDEGSRYLVDPLITALVAQQQYQKAFYYAEVAGRKADPELRQQAASQLTEAEQARIIEEAEDAVELSDKQRY